MYKCCFPGCNYKTESRSLIEFHHVHLREKANKTGKDVTIPTCPTHHKLIYHEDATAGQHSECFPESMKVKQVVNTNRGKCVIFEDMKGEEHIVPLTETASSLIKSIKWDIIHGITKADEPDLDEGIAKRVDRDGFFDFGATVYYRDNFETVAKALLSKFIEHYMEKAKSEFDSALKSARNDWLELRRND